MRLLLLTLPSCILLAASAWLCAERPDSEEWIVFLFVGVMLAPSGKAKDE